MENRALGDPFLEIQDDMDNLTMHYIRALSIIAVGEVIMDWDMEAIEEIRSEAIDTIERIYGITIVYP